MSPISWNGRGSSPDSSGRRASSGYRRGGDHRAVRRFRRCPSGAPRRRARHDRARQAQDARQDRHDAGASVRKRIALVSPCWSDRRTEAVGIDSRRPSRWPPAAAARHPDGSRPRRRDHRQQPELADPGRHALAPKTCTVVDPDRPGRRVRPTTPRIRFVTVASPEVRALGYCPARVTRCADNAAPTYRLGPPLES